MSPMVACGGRAAGRDAPMTNRRAVILTSPRVGNVQYHMVWSTLLDQLSVR
jgi:hypothetical protein